MRDRDREREQEMERERLREDRLPFQGARSTTVLFSSCSALSDFVKRAQYYLDNKDRCTSARMNHAAEQKGKGALAVPRAAVEGSQ